MTIFCRNRLIKLCVILFCSLLSVACKPSLKTQQIGSLRNIQGESLKLSDYRGKWVVINYWASWCETCWQEVAELNQFYMAHHQKDAVLFGVNFHEYADKPLRQMVHQMGMRYPNLVSDPLQSFREVTVTALPATCLFSPQGVFKTCVFGKQTKVNLEKIMHLNASK